MNISIYKKVTVLFSVLVVLLSVSYTFRTEVARADTGVQVTFFYGDGCPHCAKVEPVYEALKTKYPQVQFMSYEIYRNKDNALALYKLYDVYNVPKQDQGGVPIVFVGNEYFIGDTPIIDNLENRIIANLALVSASQETGVVPETQTTPVVTAPLDATVPQEIIPPDVEVQYIPDEIPANLQPDAELHKQYSIWAIIGAALVDSINPCAIAVLLILLTALMVSAGDKKRALYGGLAFITSIYITYFLFGLGLLQLIAVANIAGIIAKIVGVVALVIGLANIKDFFFYGGGGFVMEIPRAWRPTMKKVLNGVTSPWGAFLSGFVVTLFELPCTGGPYFFVIGLLSQAENITSIIPTLVLYNLVFILPLILILFAVYFGVSSIQNAEAWKEKNIRTLHLVSGIIMLALGVWVFFM